MPAAAVIPAPIAYIKVVAVKKLVVGFLVEERSDLRWVLVRLSPSLSGPCLALSCRALDRSSFTVKKLECSKQAYAVEYISME